MTRIRKNLPEKEAKEIVDEFWPSISINACLYGKENAIAAVKRADISPNVREMLLARLRETEIL